VAEKVEQRLPVPGKFITRDLFGFADIVAIQPGRVGVLAVQATSSSNLSARDKKVRAEQKARLWLEAGNRIQIHGWALRGPRGKRKVWTLNVREIAIANTPRTSLCPVQETPDVA
jgi:hypothetical protein